MGLSKKQQKVVEQLERRVELCREFMNDWLLFNQVLSSYPNSGVNKAQLENQFLKIKSKLAREHKVLQQSLMDDYTLDGNTMNIISGATSLEAIYSQSEVALKKLQTEWHRAFIAINETLGVIEDKKGRAERGEKVFIVTADMLAGGGKGGGGGGGMAPGTKNLLIAVAVLAVIAVVMYFDIGGIGSMYKSALGMQ
ncbi:MAG: hypothetical protein GXY15_03620 [Candidatus Hydrogenedentes bacterium]|nr:hypothetical protein [Candidatus Hydrogenedentota bacterium]